MTVKRGPSDLSREPLLYHFLIAVLGTIAHRLFTLFYRTSRSYRINGEIEQHFFAEGRPIILAHYHYWDVFYFFAFRQRRHAIMCGDRWGGDLGAFLMAKVGIETIRRTTREMNETDPGFISGVQAKEELIRLVTEDNYSAAISVDGPRGPIFSVKRGAVDLAAATGCPIVTMSVAIRPYFRVPTWDRMWLPSPFSTIVTIFGGPFYVDSSADEKQKEKMINTLQRHMTATKDLCEDVSADRKKMKSLIRGDIRVSPHFPE